MTVTSFVLELVPLSDENEFEPYQHPQNNILGVPFQIYNNHPHHFYIGVPPGL